PTRQPKVARGSARPACREATLESFADRLKEINATTGFVRELMDFTGLGQTDPARREILKLLADDPAEAPARALPKLGGQTKEDREATRKLLEKQPEKVIVKKYDLAAEDGPRDRREQKGFDLRRFILGIKAVGSSDVQKHYSLKLAIVATDNN